MQEAAEIRMSSARRVIGLGLLFPLLAATVVVRLAQPARASTGQISYVSRSSASNDVDSELTITTPSEAVAGDLLLAAVYVRDKPDVTAPSGWTFIRHNGRGRLYYRVATGTEKSSYTWTLSKSVNAGGSILVYRGVDPISPIDASSGKRHPNESTSIDAPSVTTSKSGDTIVALFAVGADSYIKPPAGLTERADKRTDGSGDAINWEVSDFYQQAAGSTGSQTATATEAGTSCGQLVALAPAPAEDPPDNPYRAFEETSYWNTSLPANAPIDPKSAGFIAYLQSKSSTNYVYVGGTDCSGAWGNAVYWPQATDPLYEVTSTRYPLPAQFSSLRIPRGVQPTLDADAEMILIDVPDGYVADVWEAEYDSKTDAWTAGGGAIYYTGSNGLHGKLPESDDSRNTGHRGFPPSSMMTRWDEIQAGSIDHVLRLSVPSPADSHVFPMIDSDGSGTDPNAPPEGARVRLKTTVDLDSMGLTSAQYALAKAAQDYGFVIGDGSGGSVTTGMENTVAEGKGCLWSGVLNSQSLKMFPLSDYEVIQLGYGQ